MKSEILNQLKSPALQQCDVSGSRSAVEILADHDVYVEHSLGGIYWCYKHQLKGERVVICSNEDKELAAQKMIDQLGALVFISANSRPCITPKSST